MHSIRHLTECYLSITLFLISFVAPSLVWSNKVLVQPLQMTHWFILAKERYDNNNNNVALYSFLSVARSAILCICLRLQSNFRENCTGTFLSIHVGYRKTSWVSLVVPSVFQVAEFWEKSRNFCSWHRIEPSRGIRVFITEFDGFFY